jgi:hypothetical protein
MRRTIRREEASAAATGANIQSANRESGRPLFLGDLRYHSHDILDFPSFLRNLRCPLTLLPLYSQLLQAGFLRAFLKSANIHARLAGKAKTMTCKVVRIVERDRLVLLHISGHLQEVHVSMIEELIAKEADPVALDLAEVTLADREVVRFLAACRLSGIGLRNCPGFIREWMSKV